MYLRFVVPSLGRYRWGLIGVIQAAWDLRDARAFSYLEEADFDVLCHWFNVYLPIPRRLSRSRRPHAASNAICWFKPSATDCIRMARRLVALLEGRGLATAMLRTRKPGYVVYEDEHQVAAVPYRDTV